MKEDDIQRSIVRHLARFYPQWLALHIPNQAIGKAGALNHNKIIYSKIMQSMGYIKGAPDLVLFNPMTEEEFIFLEVKSEKGRLSTAQKNFQQICQELWGEEKAAARYFVVRSIEDVEKILNEGRSC